MNSLSVVEDLENKYLVYFFIIANSVKWESTSSVIFIKLYFFYFVKKARAGPNINSACSPKD